MTRLEALRVMWQVVQHNPWLGFGPANYYHYTVLFPILGWWVRFNSHNNYIDLLGQTGVIGLLAFGWFAVEVSRLGPAPAPPIPGRIRARLSWWAPWRGSPARSSSGLLADWIIPFTYNIGLRGFRSSLLFWFFLGGVLSLKRIASAMEPPPRRDRALPRGCGPPAVRWPCPRSDACERREDAMIEDAVGLVPAAGRGVRLGLPYPKELYPIIRENRYKPVSQFVLDNLVASGVGHIVFVINETKHQLVGYFGDGSRFGCSISYVVQEGSGADRQSTSPGLAHALDSAYHLVRGKAVCFGMADTIMEPRDVFARAWAAAEEDDDVVAVLFPTNRPEKFGMVRLGRLEPGRRDRGQAEGDVADPHVGLHPLAAARSPSTCTTASAAGHRRTSRRILNDAIAARHEGPGVSGRGRVVHGPRHVRGNPGTGPGAPPGVARGYGGVKGGRAVAGAAGGETSPVCAVVIVCWNNRDYLEPCLRSLFGAGMRTLVEVVVVDNGSTDGSQEMLQRLFPQVGLIQNSRNLGLGRASNQGIEATGAPFVLLLNNDTLVNGASLDALIDFMAAHARRRRGGRDPAQRRRFVPGGVRLNFRRFCRSS